MARRWAWWAAAILIILGMGWRLNSAPASSREAIFSIPAGASAGQVASRLHADGQIRSRRWFLFLVRLRGATSRLKAGIYELKPGASAWGILDSLVGGRTRRVKITVPEGFASWQIAERLEKEGVCPADEFTVAAASASAEGFLYPDTYFFEPQTPAHVVVELMRARFEDAWRDVLSEAAGLRPDFDASVSTSAAGEQFKFPGRKKPWTRREVVTLASMIEREASQDEERPLISAVFHNRLKKRMRLESDPTVQFSLGYWKDRILYKDLESPSPYNTYRNFGLPPGPICNPGKASMIAALVPSSSGALYFVANEQGGHDFFETYQEHLKGVQQRRRAQRMKRQQKR